MLLGAKSCVKGSSGGGKNQSFRTKILPECNDRKNILQANISKIHK